MKNLFVLLAAAGLTACAGSRPAANGPAILESNSRNQEYYDQARRTVQPFVVQEISADSTYGFTQENPITVGGGFAEGAGNEQRYLNALYGPAGQEVSYNRRGSCCMFKTANGLGGMGLLDVYQVSWPGLAKPRILYLNMYDQGWLKAPKGFTVAK